MNQQVVTTADLMADVTTADLMATVFNFPNGDIFLDCAAELDRRCGAGTAAKWARLGGRIVRDDLDQLLAAELANGGAA